MLSQEKQELRKYNNSSTAMRRAGGKTTIDEKEVTEGDVVHIKHDGSKHETRAPHIVTKVSGDKVAMTKILHLGEHQLVAPKFSSSQKTVHRKFLMVKKAPPPLHPNHDRDLATEPDRLEGKRRVGSNASYERQ